MPGYDLLQRTVSANTPPHRQPMLSYLYQQGDINDDPMSLLTLDQEKIDNAYTALLQQLDDNMGLTEERANEVKSFLNEQHQEMSANIAAVQRNLPEDESLDTSSLQLQTAADGISEDYQASLKNIEASTHQMRLTPKMTKSRPEPEQVREDTTKAIAGMKRDNSLNEDDTIESTAEKTEVKDGDDNLKYSVDHDSGAITINTSTTTPEQSAEFLDKMKQSNHGESQQYELEASSPEEADQLWLEMKRSGMDTDELLDPETGNPHEPDEEVKEQAEKEEMMREMAEQMLDAYMPGAGTAMSLMR